MTDGKREEEVDCQKKKIPPNIQSDVLTTPLLSYCEGVQLCKKIIIFFLQNPPTHSYSQRARALKKALFISSISDVFLYSFNFVCANYVKVKFNALPTIIVDAVRLFENIYSFWPIAFLYAVCNLIQIYKLKKKKNVWNTFGFNLLSSIVR